MSLVSVIIPTFNRNKFIGRAVFSVLAQTFADFEVIIVDDGSTDNTEEIVTELCKQDSRIRYVRHEINKGAQAARNTGIRMSRGEYVAFLDSDDEITQNSLEVRLSALKNSNWDTALVYGDVWIGSNNKLIKFKKLFGYSYFYLIRELSLCPGSTIMITKRCFETSGYPTESFPSWQDDDIVLTIGKYFPLIHCNSPVAIMHNSDISITKNLKNVAIGCKRIVSKYKEDIISYHRKFRLFLWYLRIARSYILAEYQQSKLKLNKKNGILLLPYAFGLKLMGLLLTKFLMFYFDHIYA